MPLSTRHGCAGDDSNVPVLQFSQEKCISVFSVSLFSCAHAPIRLSRQVQDEQPLLLSERPALWGDATAPPSRWRASVYELEIPVTSLLSYFAAPLQG